MKSLIPLTIVLVLSSAMCSAQDVAEFDYDRQLPLDLRIEERIDRGAYMELDISYSSPAGGRVPALLFVPSTGTGPYPAVIVQHGMPGSRRGAATFAAEYARRGAVAIAITAPWARPNDEPRANIVTFTEQDAADQIQLIQDLRRAIDLLQARDDVDPDRIAYSGGSYGGAMGGLLAGVETRIVAYALWVGDGGLVAHFSRQLGRLPQAQRDAWLRAMEPIEPSRWVGQAAPAALLFQNGRQDRLVPPADAEAYHAAASEPKTILWYDEGHRLNEQAREDRREWIMERLGLHAAGSDMPWLEAMGAADRRGVITEILSDATVTVSDGLAFRTQTRYRSPDEAVFRRTYTDRTVVQGVEGTSVWSQEASTGEVLPGRSEAPPSVREGVLGHQFHAQLLFFDAIHGVERDPYPGQFQERNVMVVEGTSAWRLYFGAGSALPVGMEMMLPDGPPVRFTFHAWRETDGILLPYVVHIDDGSRTFEYRFSRVKLAS